MNFKKLTQNKPKQPTRTKLTTVNILAHNITTMFGGSIPEDRISPLILPENCNGFTYAQPVSNNTYVHIADLIIDVQVYNDRIMFLIRDIRRVLDPLLIDPPDVQIYTSDVEGFLYSHVRDIAQTCYTSNSYLSIREDIVNNTEDYIIAVTLPIGKFTKKAIRLAKDNVASGRTITIY